MEIGFFIGMPDDIPQPAPGGSKKIVTNSRTGDAVLVDMGKHNTAWKAHVAREALKAVFGILKEPLNGALYAQFSFRMPRPKYHFFKDGRLRPGSPHYHTVKPDTTKLVRACEDALTGVLWSDDARIALQLAEKIYSDKPGVDVYMSNKIPTEIRITQ